ncbi:MULTISPECIES: hypothetical protein [Marivita]|uniref:Uncharacterized protein n=1 Tax=Marivita cryptomonadis TaxID=505252 RepID=A0A9Q2P9X4_9RHOB|nr:MULTISPECIES: hypothetical protein [Marivita]MCR9169415.1 hypothetical protein [Paracoccaceae bacterium]MBM2321715.1 hypothetical protein [Marivita cryptomonadis]MBM2331296.1 hypothetical protein [Marivita cryptomonadis]MBM2340882.1 hypothetical protein [Marivita cryptomonadis]MBM2345544.1 hypothetical protein [Marivita cryptomonadis]
MIEFKPDMTTYIRAHAVMTAFAMAAGMLILWALGNPHVWTGAVGGFAAVALRGWYMADEIMDEVWTMNNTSLTGPYERKARLDDITKVRTIAGSVQIITKSGDKHLIKYQPDTGAVIDQINAARQKQAA